MLDTLKRTSIGGASFIVQFMNFIPEFVKVLVGIVTIVYFIVKIKKELR